VGLDKGVNESKTLAEKIDVELSKIGFQKEERPFTAHLTIGRVRSPKNKASLADKINSLNSQFELPDSELPTPNSQLVSSVVLFQSTLTPKGPIYTIVHTATFHS